MRINWNSNKLGEILVLCILFAATYCSCLNCEAAPLFNVGKKAAQQLQLDAIQQRQNLQAMVVPAAQPVVIAMNGVVPERSEIVVQNEDNGKSLVLSGFPKGCGDVSLTPLMIAEMKVAGLGAADSYRWSLLETAGDGSVKLVRSAGFQVAVDPVKLPVFQCRAAGVVKTTDVSDRSLVAVGQMKPTILVVNPDDPAQQALARAKEEELVYYVYTYALPDQSLATYEEVAQPGEAVQNIVAGSNLTFDCTITGGAAAAQTATTCGANLWGAQLSGTVPVSMSITFKDLGDPRIIACSYSPNAYSSGSVYYPSALRNQQVGYDTATTVTDIRLEFNSTFSFYFGTDPSACPSSQKDYITILIHEMCHGLGFYPSINSSTGVYGYGDGTMPLIYDTFLYYGGSRLTSLSASSRYSAIRSNALYWDGGNTTTANGGSRVKLYAPTTYQSGSSVSHWDVNMSFPNWMEYAYRSPLHTFNNRKLGLMKDIGWTLAGDSLAAPAGVSASGGTYSDKVRVTWNAVSGATHYRVYYSTSTAGAKTALGSWQTATTYDDASVAAEVTRYYWVQAAKDSSGTGATGYSAYDAGWRSEASTTYPDSWDPGDNTASGATLLTVSTSVGTHGPHGLAENDHYDCFKFNLIAGNTYTFESSGSSDVYGELFNSTTLDTSARVAYDDDGGVDSNFLLTYTPTVSGYYYLRVRAYAEGNTATYTLNHSYVAAQVAAPVGVAATDGTQADKVRVTWSAVSGASHYQVYRATSSTGTKTMLNTVWQSATSYDDTTAAAGTTYYYWVKAGTSSSGAAASNYSAYDTGYRSASAKPDLIPYQPSEWDSKLVVSTMTGTTTTASSFLTTDTLYLDSAVLNDGSIDIQGSIGIYDIYVDNVLKASLSTSSDLPAGYYTYYLDWNLGSLAAGSHTIKIVADPDGEVDETNETNNEYSRTITVLAPAVALSSIAITGPATVIENGTASFTCTATYNDSTTANVTATATWSENSSFATLSGGVLSAGEVSSDQTVTVTASFTAGAVTKTATKTVTITNQTDPVAVSNLAFRQRPGTKLVDITYDLSSPSAQSATVELTVKNGTTPLATSSATGHIGTNVTMGTGKAIVWNMAADWNGQVSSNISVTLSATSDGALPPVVTTNAANGVSSTSASLNGTVNPNGATTMARFEFGLTTAYGSTASVTLSPTNGTSVQYVTSNISGLQLGITYHYRLVATNSSGASTGSDMQFTTTNILLPRIPPVVASADASGITATSATLNGTVNPKGIATTARFEYGLTTAYGSTASVTLWPTNSTTAQTISASISGLQAGQIYHYRLTATNSSGTGTGADMTLTTLALPPGSDMVLIPAGSFQMGNAMTADTDITDAPIRTVTVSAFYMAKNLVTKADWDTVRTWGLTHGYTDLATGAGKAANHPVQTITWYDTVKWCNARSEKDGLTPCYTLSGAVCRTTNSDAVVCNWAANGYRLPTEAEWEKAARGGLSGKRFPWGDTITHSQANYDSYASYNYDVSPTRGYHPTWGTGSYPCTSPVGSFPANGYGLYDMAGNMFEWCWDWYGTYAAGVQTDPRGAASGTGRVGRGGCWFGYASNTRCAGRCYEVPSYADTDFGGVRVARSSVPSDMVLIPAGNFQMGNAMTADTDITDAPIRTVTVSAFYMAKNLVTKVDWDTVRTWGLSHGYTDLAVGEGKATNHPVQTITWYDMVKWCNAKSEKEGLTPCYTIPLSYGTTYKTGQINPTCNWTANGYRLPTEAEWEKAARGGLSGKRFPWGDTITHTQANYDSEASFTYDVSSTRGYHPTWGKGSDPYTSPVGSFPANGYGLCDMAGNIFEWCWDWYGNYTTGAQTDPRGVASGLSRVGRGGSWYYYADYCRVAFRGYGEPAYSGNDIAFRIARSSVP